VSFNDPRGGGDRVLSCNVDFDKVNISEFGLLELSDGVLAPFGVARTEQHGTSGAAEVTRQFQI
jgi:hypothetical protein